MSSKSEFGPNNRGIHNQDVDNSERARQILTRLYKFGLEGKRIRLPSSGGEVTQLERKIEEGLSKGGSLSIVSPTCPDYSSHINRGQREYDFESLGTGLGLAGETLLEAVVVLKGALDGCGINRIDYTIIMADVEADDPEILQRVGLDKREFLSRLRISNQALQEEQLRRGLLPRASMMSNFLAPEDQIRAEVAISMIKLRRIEAIATARVNLYARWFKPDTIDELNLLARSRAKVDILKYLTFGMAARRLGVIVLETTAPQIAGLYNFGDGRVRRDGVDLPPLLPTPVIMIEKEY